MQFRLATDSDVKLLAEWSRQVIQDEGHRNRMTLPELEQGLRDRFQGEYEAVIFAIDTVPVGYAFYRREKDSIYLRPFFVNRSRRRSGVGRQAVQLLQSQVWP